MLTIIALAIGVAIGLLRGGKLSTIRGARVLLVPVLIFGVVLQSIAEFTSLPGTLTMSIAGMFLLIVGLLANNHIRGTGVAAVGVLSNLLVTVLNGHVPIRFNALVEIGQLDATVEPGAVSISGLRELETAGSNLSVLGDVIPLNVLGNVISFGDLITHAGIIVIVQGVIAARRRFGITVDELFGPDPVEAHADQPTIDLATTDPEPDLVDLTAPSPSPIDLRQPQTEPALTSADLLDLIPASRTDRDQPVPILFEQTDPDPRPSDLDLGAWVGLDIGARAAGMPARSANSPFEAAPFEEVPSERSPFDYGEADDFSTGIGSIRPLSR